MEALTAILAQILEHLAAIRWQLSPQVGEGQVVVNEAGTTNFKTVYDNTSGKRPVRLMLWVGGNAGVVAHVRLRRVDVDLALFQLPTFGIAGAAAGLPAFEVVIPAGCKLDTQSDGGDSVVTFTPWIS